MMSDVQLLIEGYELVQTCGACPEQYEVFDTKGNQVGYLRLRHGTFRVDYPDCGGTTIYTAHTEGDGRFTKEERHTHLSNAIKSIQTHIMNLGEDNDSSSSY